MPPIYVEPYSRNIEIRKFLFDYRLIEQVMRQSFFVSLDWNIRSWGDKGDLIVLLEHDSLNSYKNEAFRFQDTFHFLDCFPYILYPGVMKDLS